jgi:hypothetical protein
MKIAIVGAEATGRTALAQGLGATLGLPVLADSRAALLEQSGYATLFEWGAATDGWVAWLTDQVLREGNTPRGIIDAGALDISAQLVRWAWNKIAPDRIEALEQAVRAVAATYSHVLQTPGRLVAPHAPSRFRSVNNTGQTHRLVSAIVRELAPDAPLLVLSSGDEAALLAQACSFIRTHG